MVQQFFWSVQSDLGAFVLMGTVSVSAFLFFSLPSSSSPFPLPPLPFLHFSLLPSPQVSPTSGALSREPLRSLVASGLAGFLLLRQPGGYCSTWVRSRPVFRSWNWTGTCGLPISSLSKRKHRTERWIKVVARSFFTAVLPIPWTSTHRETPAT